MFQILLLEKNSNFFKNIRKEVSTKPMDLQALLSLTEISTL